MTSATDRQSVELLASIHSPYPADVLLFHPADPSYFIVGTYLLDEQTRIRHGKLCTYHLASITGTSNTGSNASLIAEVQCDAILDMKWYNSLLYVAHSTGSISIYEWSIDQDSASFSLRQHSVVLSPEVLIMSLSVSARGIITSHSDGTMATWTHDLQEKSTWQVSDLEVWIQAESRDEHIVYSGSDDGVLAAWDTRTCSEGMAPATLKNRKSHGAGVTAILPYGADHELLTGSYDDHIRRFDLRAPHRARDEVNLGGGVWRIIPKGNGELLTCCMYNGAKIVQDGSFDVVKEFDAHESIVYGGDVAGDINGTCSFYDESIHIWK